MTPIRVQRKPLRTGHQVTHSSPWPRTHTHRRTPTLPLPFHTNTATHSSMNSSFQSRTAGRNGDFIQLAAVPAQTCATQQHTLYITQQTLSRPPIPLSFSIFPCILPPDPSVFIPFPAPSSFSLTFAAVENDDIHSVPPHILQNTRRESLDGYNFSKKARIKSFRHNYKCSSVLLLDPVINKELRQCYITCF